MAAAAKANNEIKRIVVYGAGLMGTGIAQVAAAAGYGVTLVDQKADAVQRAQARIAKAAASASKVPTDAKGAPGTGKFGDVKGTTNAVEAAREADVVIECIVEKLEAKHALLKEVDAYAPAHAIFATNTSSILVSKIMAGLPSSSPRRARVAGLHFFNPVPSMKLVELVRAPETSPEVVSALDSLARRMGKVVVHCHDTPGFVVNRLLVPYIMESIRMAERGTAAPRDIDTAMKLGAGYPMGPFELADFVGLDTLKHIIQGWHDGDGSPDGKQSLKGDKLVAPSALLDQLVQQGKLGRKSGAGFYEYPAKNPASAM